MSAAICYMCGRPSTKRLKPDLDMAGIPLCDTDACKDLMMAYLMMPDLEMNQGMLYDLERNRKKMHKEAGNPYSK